MKAMSYVAEKVSSTKYLSVPTVLETTGLSKEELDRAMALGFVSVIEIGTTRFIERSSLDKYITVQEEKSEPTVSPFMEAPEEVPQKPDNMIFQEALSREMALEKRRSLLPAVVVAALSLVALLLAMPLPQDMEESRAAAIEAVAPEDVRIQLKEAVSNFFGFGN